MNRICIEPTKFTDVRTGNETFGYRAWDDFAQTYNNCLDSIPDDDLMFLAAILGQGADDTLNAMLDYCAENQHSLQIGKEWYTWKQIQPIVEKARK